MAPKSYIVEAGPARAATSDKPAAGPIYRAAIAPKEAPRFSDVSTLYESFMKSVEKYPNNNCLGHVEGGAMKYITYKQTAEQVEAISSAMVATGVKPHSRCGVFGANSPEWMIAMQSPTIVFVQTQKFKNLVAALGHEALKGRVKTVVYWGKGDADSAEATKAMGIDVYSFVDFMELGKKNPAPAVPPKPEDLCTLMYTSGTTGDPKGVQITHGAQLSVTASVEAFLQSIEGARLTANDVYLSFLPLAHIFDRSVEETFLHLGASIGYWRGDIKGLVDDIALVRPTLFAGVPRVFDRIYAGVMAKIAEGGFLKQALFNWGYGRKTARLQEGLSFDKATPIFDKIIFSKVKERLGGRVRIIISGGAPLSRHVEDFLRVCMCCRVVQGYGLTESCAASFIAVPDEPDHFGTVGPPQPCQEFRLEAVTEMKYDPMSKPPRGEVLIRGPNMFTGYYKKEDQTLEVLEADGWFHTGDIGELTATGGLRIIDRKKNIFKLSQGEYVAVEKVENVYKKNQYVEQIWVYGNSFESCLVAVVVPNDKLKAWAKQNNHSGDMAALCHNDAVKKMLLADLSATGKEGKLKGFEMVKAVYMESELFGVENELMTPTFKLKRPQLQKRYQAEVDALYAALNKA